MGAVLRCKMRVEEVLHRKNTDGSTEQEQVKLCAVYAKEGPNAEWSKYTPSASFAIYINNPSAFGRLSRGHEFFVDFTPAEEKIP